MGDFLAILGAGSRASDLSRLLRERPFLAEREVETARFGWGAVTLLVAPGRGDRPGTRRGRFAGAVGRPRLMGVEHEARGDSGFADLFLERAETERLETLALSLTGMGAVLLADEGGLTVVTDRMGARPVYVGHDGDGRLVAVGSHVESLARVCARERDFDLVSLGELIVHNYVTWPWTSREGIRELEPGSITILSPLAFPESAVARLPQRLRSRIQILDEYAMRSFPTDRIGFARIEDFKGLENEAVVVVDVPAPDRSAGANAAAYVAMSRPRAVLSMVYTGA